MQPQSILATTISQTRLPERTVALWWLGQASFAVRSTSMTLLLDPFLSDNADRLVPAPFTAEASPSVDLVLCTHEHIDHFDAPTVRILAQKSPHTRFIVPRPIIDQVLALDVAPERILGVQPDEEHTVGDVRILPLPAQHQLNVPPGVYDFGFALSNNLYRYLGYVIELAGVRIYHPGDTLVYDGLVERLRPLNIDIALLPINGRSYFREQQHLAGNMHEQEAAELAAVAGIKLLIPTHYEMFAANLGDPGVLINTVRRNHPQVACYVPAHGRRFTYMAEDSAT